MALVQGINLTASLISQQNFTGLNFTRLFLGYKNLTSVVPRVFNNFSNNVTEFIFYFNKFQVIENNWLLDLVNLTILDLRYNSICAIDSDAFNSSKKLKSLNLYSNSLKTINKKCLDDMPQLVELDLGYNQISSLADDTFNSSKNLKILNFNSNFLKTINKNCMND